MATPTTTLNVIALISGGKDSFFSLHHCIANGHRIVALANLHPPPHHASPDTENEMDSYMYQTVGHTLLPLYADALGLPLYRRPIAGQPLNTHLSYFPAADEDETESLLPLLRHILTLHPSANAVSSGAILSTYQRTRIESVALRLGITSLAYLWQYPLLPPRLPTSLLQDMQAAGLEARIVKVASGGLDERMLWLNVAGDEGIRQLLRALQRFGGRDALRGGAVLGEGGEYETLVLQGPRPTWKGRIRVEGRAALDGGAGAASVGFAAARAWVEPFAERGEAGEEEEQEAKGNIRIPPLLDPPFQSLLDNLLPHSLPRKSSRSSSIGLTPPPSTNSPASIPSTWHVQATSMSYMLTLRPTPTPTPHASLTAELLSAFNALASTLATLSTPSPDMTLTHATVLLRSISAFSELNSLWHAAFRSISPPARITVACGDSMPPRCCSSAVLMQVLVQRGDGHGRKPLHVQSRSYWAPASIGPYAQAVGVPVGAAAEEDDDDQGSIVHLAGQIPLVPARMELATRADLPAGLTDGAALFRLHAALSLQHIWRVGAAMGVAWWMAGVAFIAAANADEEGELLCRAETAFAAWQGMHLRPSPPDNEEGVDTTEDPISDLASPLPDFTLLLHTTATDTPPLVVAQVSALPRNAPIEWATTGFCPPTHRAAPCIEQLSSSTPDEAATATSHTYTSTLSTPRRAPLLRLTHTTFFFPPATPPPLRAAVQRALGAEVVLGRRSGLQLLRATLYVGRGVVEVDEVEMEFTLDADDASVLVAVVPCVRLWSCCAGEGAARTEEVGAVLVTWLEG